MTIYYVDSTATGGANTGGTWVNAFLTFAQGVTAATTEGDQIFVSHAHSESLSADTTYTFAAVGLQVFCVNSGTGTLATTGLIGAQATSYAITFAGGAKLYIYGLTIQLSGSSSKNMSLLLGDGCHVEYESCKFTMNTGASSQFHLGLSSANANSYVKMINCTIKYGATGQTSLIRTRVDFVGCTIDPAGSTLTTWLAWTSAVQTVLNFHGCDLSALTGTLIGNNTGGQCWAEFSNCKLGSGVTVVAAAATVLNKGNSQAILFNCAVGDEHFHIAHYDALGSTTVSSAIYANTGAKYDGTNGCSWKITTTANCTFFAPYVSPWFERYHAATAAITPRVEILRDASATAYQDDEVWAEFSYQGTSGSPLATIVRDRMTPLGTPANQGSSALGASDWTGENATAWFGKLEPLAAITPAEIGMLGARICVGEPSITVYVDPTIRIT